MALVLLPCDLPTWPTVQRYLNQLKQVQSSSSLVEGMQKIHNLCCVGLDPDDDKPDPHRFDGLEYFIEKVLTDVERNRFFNTVLSCMINNALKLKLIKPINGLHFSLQQQADQVAFDRRFVLSLLANAFFSTFPKRTIKTHPTLQDFNFCDFFADLKNIEQQIKLRCILQYFDLAATHEPQGQIIIARQVIPKWDTQTLNDWLNCTTSLCPLIVRHEGVIEDAEEGMYLVCFASQRIGGKAFLDGWNQEEMLFFKNPELLIALLYVESLEDNEAFSAHNWINIGHISENKKFCPSDKFKKSNDTHLCGIDAKNFVDNWSSQYEDRNLLRELSKAYLGFQQRKHISRLSPIGESCSSTSPERQSSDAESCDDSKKSIQLSPCLFAKQKIELDTLKKDGEKNKEVRKTSDSVNERPPIDGFGDSDKTNRLSNNSCALNVQIKNVSELPQVVDQQSNVQKGIDNVKLSEKLSTLMLPDIGKLKKHGMSESSEGNYKDAVSTQSSLCSALEDEQWVIASEAPLSPSTSENRPLFFSLSETKPVDPLFEKLPTLKSPSKESECSDDDEYQSCVEDIIEDDACLPKPDLVSSTGRWLLAESLRDVMQDSSCQSDMEDSSYALDIHIEGPDVRDREGICVRRAPSTGFLLDEDDHFVGDSLEAEQAWLKQFRNRSLSRSVSRRNSSRYSFSSDFSSDLEDIYEHFEEMMAAEPVSQDPAVAQYVGGLLKRTLSDSFTTASRKGTISSGGDASMPRSLSLVDHLTQERLALEKAKQQTLSSMPIQKRSVEKYQKNGTDENGCNRRMSGQLVSIVLEQSLAQVEEKIALSLPKEESKSIQKQLDKLHSQMSNWWNYNNTNDVDLKASTLEMLSPKSNSPLPSFFDTGLPVSPSACVCNQLAANETCDKGLHEFCNLSSEIKLVPSHDNINKISEDHIYSNTKVRTNSSNVYSSCSELSSFTSQESYLDDHDSKYVDQSNTFSTLRRWISRSDSALLWISGKDKNHDFQELRKWDALCDLQDNDSNNCPSKAPSFRPRSHSADVSLESAKVCSRFTEFTDFDEDTDQFWIVLDDDPVTSNDEQEYSHSRYALDDSPRKRVRSFSGTRCPTPRNLRRTSSEGAFQKLNSSKYLEVSKIDKEYSEISPRVFGACLGPRYEIFPTLQSIAERKEVDGISSSPTGNVTPCEEIDKMPSLHSSTFDFLSNAYKRTLSIHVQSEHNSPSVPPHSLLPSNCNREDSVSSSSSHECKYLSEFRIDPDGYRPIATGNWGCGNLKGDPQLKAIIQWLAASRCGIPCLLYFTNSKKEIIKLDIVSRVLGDRHWTVGTLMKEVLEYCHSRKDLKENTPPNLFDKILPNDIH